MAQEKKSVWKLLDKKMALPPGILFVIAIVIGLVNQEGFANGASTALNFTLKYFSWFYALGATFLLVFCLWAGYSKYGNIKFGGPDAKPEMSRFQWWAISLCAGIAIGIVFYGVAEPMTHYMSPPPFLGFEPGSIGAGETALRYSFFHWTFHTYGIYTSCAVCMAFAYYNTRKPFKVSSSFYPLIGEKIHGSWGSLIDALALFAIIGGVGTSLGFGTLQIGGGLKYAFGINAANNIGWLIIILVLTFCYTLSSYTGLHRGIKFLSRNNVYIYFILIAWVLIFGPTIDILNHAVTSIGDYLINIVPMTFYLDPMLKSGWTGAWSIFYWAWWLAFAPIVGLFLVRLAYGRTIKEFITVNLVAPASFGILWFGVFGSAAIQLEHFANAGIGKIISELGIEVSLFALLEKFPLAIITMTLGMLAVAISFITLADSMTSTIASMTTVGFEKEGTNMEAPASMKIFWGIVMGIFSWVLLITGGASALQTSVIVCGLPILFVQLFMCFGYFKAMFNLKEYDFVNPHKEDESGKATNVRLETDNSTVSS